MSTVSNLLGTGIIVLLIAYFRTCQYDLNLHKKTLQPGGGGVFKFPVKLFYTGNMPIILFISAVNNLFIISQNLSGKYKKVSLVKILGVWKKVAENSGKSENN
jgi:protein transport protein SEC61 subunit alpha